MIDKDKNLIELCKKFDGLIKAGKASEVRAELRKLISGKKLPRKHLLSFATIARRADAALIGLKLLNPVVHPLRKEPIPATDLEKVEYAFCLSNSGAYAEALNLLKTVSVEKVPQALLAQSFCHVAVWNYAEALIILEKYCKSPLLTPYELVIGEANLAAALIVEKRASEADELCVKLIDYCKKNNNQFLLGKLLSLRAQNAIHCGLWERVPVLLKEARENLGSAGGVDQMLLDKWFAIYELHVAKGSKESLLHIRNVRSEAIKIKHWESIRQCDAYEAIYTQNARLALHVYFGTPFSSFRKSFVSDYGSNLMIPDSYLLELGSKKMPATLIDLTGTSNINKLGFKRGLLSDKMLLALASDFYRPKRVTSLHYAMYPEAFYNPVSSPDKVHQAIRRLRKELSAENIPLEICEDKGLYTLNSDKFMQIRISRNIEPKSRHQVQLEFLQERFKSEPFSVSEAAKALDLAIPTSFLILNEALLSGALNRFGKGKATRYQFIQAHKIAA